MNTKTPSENIRIGWNAALTVIAKYMEDHVDCPETDRDHHLNDFLTTTATTMRKLQVTGTAPFNTEFITAAYVSEHVDKDVAEALLEK